MRYQHKETWREFGDHLSEYITSEMSELEKKSYDLIISFSRGGTILAFTFACLLKDNSIKYSNQHKASVRPIPSGINVKIDNPCFVMDHPASQQEKDDIKNNLKRDLEYFSKKYNGGNALRILVMDDNLTGATRIKFLDRVLTEIENEPSTLVECHSSLAYVRHKSFQQDIPTIRNFPEDADYFVMPWHNPSLHTPKELRLRDSHPELENLVFTIKLNCDPVEFKNEVKKRCEIDYEFRSGVICNGASNFVIKEVEEDTPEFVDVLHFSHMLYPPKTCLFPNGSKGDKVIPTKNFHPLCDYFKGGEDDVTIDLCNTCVCLNCNRKLITHILLAAANSNRISLKPIFKRGIYDEALTNAIDEWFEKWVSSAFWV